MYPSFRIPNTRVAQFYKDHAEGFGELRLGQAFYNYMDLGKMSTDTEYRDALHAADGFRATALINNITDWEN